MAKQTVFKPSALISNVQKNYFIFSKNMRIEVVKCGIMKKSQENKLFKEQRGFPFASEIENS